MTSMCHGFCRSGFPRGSGGENHKCQVAFVLLCKTTRFTDFKLSARNIGIFIHRTYCVLNIEIVLKKVIILIKGTWGLNLNCL